MFVRSDPAEIFLLGIANMNDIAQEITADQAREMLQVVLAALDRLDLTQAAIHVALAIESLQQAPSS